jgi:hypothetical protein
MLSAIDGVEIVLQQTPLDVIATPPLEEILPPTNAEDEVIPDTSVVVKTGIDTCGALVDLSQAIINKMIESKIIIKLINFE